GPAAGVLRVMSAGLSLIFFNLVARYALTALDRQSAYLRAVAWGLAANAAVGVLLVPRFGALGACAAYLAAEAPIAALCLRAPRGRLTLLSCGEGAPEPLLAKLEAIASQPFVQHVLALPDLHQKANAEVPSSLAVVTRGVVVPEFTSVAINDGMGVVVTDLQA